MAEEKTAIDEEKKKQDQLELQEVNADDLAAGRPTFCTAWNDRNILTVVARSSGFKHVAFDRRSCPTPGAPQFTFLAKPLILQRLRSVNVQSLTHVNAPHIKPSQAGQLTYRFTYPEEMTRLSCLGGWLYTAMVYLSRNERSQRMATTSIKHEAQLSLG